MNIAIIGAGFSGCYLYKKLFELGHNITIFEKARGTGGRLSTKYINDKFIDHGTPYFKAKNTDFMNFCDELVQYNVLAKVHDIYTPINGINKVCSSLIDKKDLIKLSRIVKCDYKDKKWTLFDEDKNYYDNFDVLLITIPSPQILELDINIDESFRQLLKNVSYTSVASLILHSDDELNVDENVKHSDFFKKVVDNSAKYDYENFNSFIFHANENFSTVNNYKSKEDLGLELYKYIEYYQKNKLKKVKTIPHLWKYAFVQKGLDLNCYYNKNSSLGFCGDYFKYKNLEGSFLSANSLLYKLI